MRMLGRKRKEGMKSARKDEPGKKIRRYLCGGVMEANSCDVGIRPPIGASRRRNRDS